MLTTEQLKHPSLVDRVVEHVYQQIISGGLQRGQRITEDQIAAATGVSRTPVREAVKRLAEMGVVVVHPRARLEVASPDAREIREIAELRQELEAMAIKLAIPRLSEDDLQRMETICQECRRFAEEGDRLAAFGEDSRFHLAIAELSGNRYLCEALRRLDVKVQLCRAFACLDIGKIRRDVAAHRRILQAMKQRDAAAAQAAMRKHIHDAALGKQGDRE